MCSCILVELCLNGCCLFAQLLPGVDLTQEVEKLLEEVDVPIEFSRDDEDEGDTTRMTGKLAKLDLNPPQNRFFGKSRYVDCFVSSSLQAGATHSAHCLQIVHITLYKRHWI